MPSERRYRDEFQDFTGNDSEAAFQDFYLLFQEAGADDDLDTWFEFLNTFYPDTEPHDKEFWDDVRKRFYDYSGLTDQNIDWELWRSIIEEISPGGA